MIGNVNTQPAYNPAGGYPAMRPNELIEGDPAEMARRIISDFDGDANGSVDRTEIVTTLAGNGIENAEQTADDVINGLGGEAGALTVDSLATTFAARQREMNLRIDLMRLQAAMRPATPAVPAMPPAAGPAAPRDPAAPATDAAPVDTVAAPVADGGTATDAQPGLPGSVAAPATETPPSTGTAPSSGTAPTTTGAPATVGNRVSEFLTRYDTDGDGTAEKTEIAAVLADRGVADASKAAEAMIARFGGNGEALSADQIGEALRARDRAAAGLWESPNALETALQPAETTTPTTADLSTGAIGSGAAAVPPGDALAVVADDPDGTTGAAETAGTTGTTGTAGAADPAPTTGTTAAVAPSVDTRTEQLFGAMDADGDGAVSRGELATMIGQADQAALTVAASSTGGLAVVTPDVGARLGSLLDRYRTMSGDTSFDDLRPMFDASA